MSSVVIAGNTSGTITLDAPNVAGTTVLTLPTSNGTIVSANSSNIISVSGVKFPATQSASADANTLDDYEEGTWTPLIQNSSASESISLGASAGDYIKIGRMVWVGINKYAVNSSAITASTQIYLRGFPFSCETINTNACYISSVMSQYPAQPVSLIDFQGTAAPMYAPSTAQDWVAFTRNVWGGQTSISWRMSFCYMASA
jgi:hypothetical protein